MDPGEQPYVPVAHYRSLQEEPAVTAQYTKSDSSLADTEQTMDMMKRTSSQAYETGPSLGGIGPVAISTTTGGHTGSIGNLEGFRQPQSGGLGEGISKKARFVSEGHVPAMNYTGASGALPYAQVNLSAAPPGYLNAATLSALASQQNAPYGTDNADSRSFSGSMINTGGSLAGMPTSPFMGPQYAAMPGTSGTGQPPGSFSPPGGPHSAPFMGHRSSLGAPMFTPGFQSTGLPGTAGMSAFLPNVGLLAMPHQSNATGRTVYVGNLPAEASVDELLNQVKFGPIENIRILPEKSCAFISFLDGGMAAAFHADASVKKMSLHNQELKIGWGKPSACPTPILMAVQQNQATRNVYLGQLEENVTEQSLRDDLARFGPIDQVKIVRDKNIAFVHFLSIGTAMKVVSMLPTEPAWAGKRVNYGKDRCAYVPKSQQQNQAHNNQAAAMGMAAAASLGYPTAFTPGPAAFAGYGGMGPASAPPNATFGTTGQMEDPASPGSAASLFGPLSAANVSAMHQLGNRTVYLGNIHPDTTTEEICNHIRGGILQSIRFIPEKHIAFLTFVDSNAALAFYHLANYSGIMIHQRRLKIGWGKPSGPLSPAIAMAVQAGGSRNVYIGNIEDFDFHTVEKLRRDFGEYGETELVNTLKEKSCAFVNFCNIQNAIKAIEAMKNHPDYKNQRVGAGKDRCGNPPRVIANSLNAGRSNSGSLSPNTQSFLMQGAQQEIASGGDETIDGADGSGMGAIVPQDEESHDTMLSA